MCSPSILSLLDPPAATGRAAGRSPSTRSHTITAKTSSSRINNNSLSPTLNSSPAYEENSTRSPTLTWKGVRFPVLEHPPVADADHPAVRGLVLGGVRQHDPACGDLFRFLAFNDQAVCQRLELDLAAGRLRFGLLLRHYLLASEIA